MQNSNQINDIISKQNWTPTPFYKATSLSHKLNLNLWLKREDCTPIGSFKIRGALIAMDSLGDSIPDTGVCVASAGNYGLAISTAGQSHGIKTTVFVPENATESKVEKIRLSGATVIQKGSDFDTAKNMARKYAESNKMLFWEDGVLNEMVCGSSTIAREIISVSQDWDYIIVPVGNGSLIKGIAEEIKKTLPSTKILGVVPSGSPAMYQALTGIDWDESASPKTTADGLSVRIPIKQITEEIKPLIDDVFLIKESKLLPAVKTFIEQEQMAVETSAAICLAGITEINGLDGKNVAAIITGSHIQPRLLQEALAGKSLL